MMRLRVAAALVAAALAVATAGAAVAGQPVGTEENLHEQAGHSQNCTAEYMAHSLHNGLDEDEGNETLGIGNNDDAEDLTSHGQRGDQVREEQFDADCSD